MNGDSTLYCAGINHKTSNIEQREKFQFGKKEVAPALRAIFDYPEVEGIVLVDTCNRIEFYLATNNGTDPLAVLSKYFGENRSLEVADYSESFYVYKNEDACEHLFRTIAGLDSLVFGEYQIQGQIKDAYSLACGVKTVEKTLHKLFHAAFRTGKKIRSQTQIGAGRQSVAGAASKIATEKLRSGDRVAIIGVNENTRIFATEISKFGTYNYHFVNRTKYKAEMLADEFAGKAYGLDELEKVLFKADAVFTSTGAPGAIIGSETLRRLKLQDRLPRLIIDMAAPRDTDVSALNGSVEYFDIGKLKEVLDLQKQGRLMDAPIAEKIIEEELNAYKAWRARSSDDILEGYSEKFELIRQRLLEENRSKFSEQHFEKIDKLTKSLAHRMQSGFVSILLKERSRR